MAVKDMISRHNRFIAACKRHMILNSDLKTHSCECGHPEGDHTFVAEFGGMQRDVFLRCPDGALTVKAG
jgi:hypothetical protein